MAVRKRARKTPSKSEGQDGFLQRLGPGLITGASDDDPSGIGTYSQAGAQLGFSVGWTMQRSRKYRGESGASPGTASRAMSAAITLPRLSGR
jgi:hypothetical protein